MSKIPLENINELDFEVAKENFLSFVRNRSEFGDYDFEASGLNFLVDLLAYNTQYNAFYLNQLYSEMFLDTAQQRKNVVSIAKQMGYLSNSKKASNAVVRMTLGQIFATQRIINLDVGTSFIGRTVEGRSFPFISDIDYNFTPGNNFTVDVKLIQGRYITQTIEVNQLRLEVDFIISSRDVDLNYLDVFVREEAESTNRERYVRVEDITLLDKDSQVYYIEENYDGYYKIIFGDGVIGKKIRNNNLIELSYLVTSGSEGNDCVVFSLEDSTILPSLPSIQTLQLSAQGNDREDIEEVRRNARKMYFSQNRTVTENDYSILLRKHFPYIETISVWGGEKNEIPMYGTVYCAIKPKEKDFLSDLEKETIVKKLDTLNIISVVPKIVDPEYVYVTLDVDITFDIENIENTANEIIQLVEEKIISFSKENLLKFGNSFQTTALERIIDLMNPYFIGTKTEINLYQTKKIITNTVNAYKVNFNNRVRENSLKTTMFSYYDAHGNEHEKCTIKESIDRTKLEIHRVEVDETTNMIIPDVGSINYEEGMISLENFSPIRIINNSSEIKFEMKIETVIVHPTINQILVITKDNVNVNATGIITNK